MGTHPIPVSLPAPLPNWNREFLNLRKNLGLENMTLMQVNEIAQTFLEPVLKGVRVGRWDPLKRSWE